MTDNEFNKLARLQAMYLAEELKTNKDLLDKVFPPKYLDVKESAEYMRLPLGSFYKITCDIPHSQVGKRLIFSQRDLDEYARKNKVLPVDMAVTVSGIKKVM